MLSHDYRWLAGSIKQALRDDHEAARHVGHDARSWQMIENENRLKAEKKAQHQQQAAARDDTGAPAAAADPPAPAATSDEPPPGPGEEPLESTIATVSTASVDDATSHDPDLVDPSSVFPPDKARPFTSVHLVAFSPQQDWSVIKKRAAAIADLRKQQLSHAYQNDQPASIAGQSTAAQREYLRRQNRLDRKRMKQHDREKRAAERAKQQKLSTMVLSSEEESSSDDSSDESDDDPALRHGVLAGYHSRAKNHLSRPRTVHHPDSGSDEERDGPPADEEEIVMRLKRAAWRKTREAIDRTLHQVDGGATGAGGGPRSPPGVGSGLLQLATSSGTSGMTPHAALLMQRRAAGGRSASILLSNDSRVQSVYTAVAAELEVKTAAEKKAREEQQRRAAKKAADKAHRLAKRQRYQESLARHRRAATVNHLTPTTTKRKVDLLTPLAVPISAAARLLDRSAPSATADATVAAVVGSTPTSPIGALSRSQSALSLHQRHSPTRVSTTTSGTLGSPSNTTKSLAHSDSAPVLSIGGHLIRASSPSRYPKTHVASTTSDDANATSTTGALTATVTPAATSISQPSSGSLLSLNNPLLARRRARTVLPLLPGAALMPSTSVKPTSDDESSDTFLTGVPNLAHSAAAASAAASGASPAVFSVPEYASPSSPPMSMNHFAAARSPPIASRSLLPPAIAASSSANNSAASSGTVGAVPAASFPMASATMLTTNVLSPAQAPSTASILGQLRPTSTLSTARSHASSGEALSTRAPLTDDQHRPTTLQPVTSLVRTFTGNPLAQLSTTVAAAPSAETEKVLRALRANLAAADEEIRHILTPEHEAQRRTAEQALLNDDPFSFLRATASLAANRLETPRMRYARARAEKSELATKVMMSFSHDDMQNISQEIIRQGGELTCADFIRTTRRKPPHSPDFAAETEALAEMFREIDINGDGSLSFLEFTSYLVELAHTQYGGGASSAFLLTSALDHLESASASAPTYTPYQALEDVSLLPNDDDLDYVAIKWFDALSSFVALEKDQVRFKVLNKSLRCTKVVRGHSAKILAFEYLPVHQLLVTSSLDKTLRFWSANWDKDGRAKAQEERLKQEMQAQAEKAASRAAVAAATVAAVASASSPTGGATLASGKMRETMRFKGTAAGNATALQSGGDLLSPHRTNPLSLPITNVGLAAYSTAGTVGSATTTSSFSRNSPAVPTYAEIACWQTPLAQHCLVWNKTRLYSSDATGRILIWNVDSGDTRANLVGHEAKVNVMLPIPDMLASAGDDATVRLWDNVHLNEVACLRKHQRPLRALCHSAATNLLASGGDDEYIRLWDCSRTPQKHVSSFFFENTWFKTLPGHEQDSVIHMECVDHELIVGTRRGSFRLYDLRMMVPLQTFDIPDVEEEAFNNDDATDDPTRPKKKKLLSGLGSGLSGLGDETELETEVERMRRRARITLSSFCVYKDEALIEQHAQRVKAAQRERDEERQRILDDAAEAGAPLDPNSIVAEAPLELPRDPRCQLIIGTSGKYIHRYGKGGSVTRTIAHEEPLLHAEVNLNSLTVFTASAKQVRIWCLLTGRLNKEYNDLLTENEQYALAAATSTRATMVPLITSACLDQRQRKFILGDNLGNISIYNYNTGALMHQLSNTAAFAPSKSVGTGALTTSPKRDSSRSSALQGGTEILNLQCIVNKSYQANISGGSGSGTNTSDTEPHVSINFIHSLSNSIHIHVDDPDHALGKEANDKASNAAGTKKTTTTVATTTTAASTTTPARNTALPETGNQQARTVLHSLVSHKQDITCIAVSTKFNVVLSGSNDGSIVMYPAELAGSPLQRIIPAEALHAIAQANGQAGAEDATVDSFRTPILTVVFLHPYKMFACSDSLGHVLFYYFNRDSHVLIGLIRNSKRLENLGSNGSGLASPSKSSLATSALGSGRRLGASMRGSARGSVRGSAAASRRMSLTSDTGSIFSDDVPTIDAPLDDGSDPLAPSKRAALIDYPPILCQVFDAPHLILYVADDMGFVKGFKLREVLFQPHSNEYRARKWNDFASRAPSRQQAPRTLTGGIAHFPYDDHALLTPDDIKRVFHAHAYSRQTYVTSVVASALDHGGSDHSGTTFSVPTSMVLRVRPFLVIQAHSGACNGVQLIDAAATLLSRADAAAQEAALEFQAQVAESALQAAPVINVGGPTSSGTIGSRTQPTPTSPSALYRASADAANRQRAAAANNSSDSATSSKRSSLGVGGLPRIGSADSSSAVASSHTSPRNDMQILQQGLQRARGSSAGSQAAFERDNEKDKTVAGPSKKELDDAKLKRWEEQKWNEDTSDDDDDDEEAAALEEEKRAAIASALTSTNTSRPTSQYRDARDLPDRMAKGHGRRVSVAMELSVTQKPPSRKHSRAPSASINKPPVQTATTPAEAASTDASQLLPSRQPTGPCLLTFGSDGCVHLFSVATRKRVGTLQQGFTTRNTRVTPSEWRYTYPIAARRTQDKAMLEDTLADVEASQRAQEQRLREERARADAAEVLRRKQIRDQAYADSIIAREMYDPFKRILSKSRRASLRMSGQGLLLPPGLDANSGVKEADANDQTMSSVPASNRDHFEEKEQASDPHSDTEDDQQVEALSEAVRDALLVEADEREQRRLTRDFRVLEKNIKQVLRKDQMSNKTLRSAESGEAHPTIPVQDQAKDLVVQRTILKSKSMSALTPSLYSVPSTGNAANGQFPAPLSGSASSASLLSVPGARLQPPPSSASPTKRFQSIEHDAFWVDYDGTQRTFDDPLAYRFHVDKYLADVATRHEQKKSQQTTLGGMAVTVSSASPMPAGGMLTVDTTRPARRGSFNDSSASAFSTTTNLPEIGSGRSFDSLSDTESASRPSSHAGSARFSIGSGSRSEIMSPTSASSTKRNRRSVGPGTISTRAPVDTASFDADMALQQKRALERARLVALEEARAARKAKARGLAVLQATLAREKELQTQLGREGQKLSPRSAEVVRARMLLSRKPLKLVEAHLESVGMRIEEAPKARLERGIFGELKEVEETHARRRRNRAANPTKH